MPSAPQPAAAQPTAESGPRSSETREAIVAAAQRLFFARGYKGASLRAITAAAGVNLAAVNYHFGSKEGLLRAVVDRSIAPVNAGRLARLDALQARPGRTPGVEEILEGLLRPVLDAGLAAEAHAAMSILFTEPAELVQPMLRDVFAVVGGRFVDALHAGLPHLSREEVAARFDVVIGAMSHVVSGRALMLSQIAAPDSEHADPEWVLSLLTTSLAAALRAPSVPSRRPLPGAPL